MFNFSKSCETPTLNNKTDVQYKIMCDWLRSTKTTVDRLERGQKMLLLDISKLYDLLLKDDSPPESIEDERSDIDNSGSIL